MIDARLRVADVTESVTVTTTAMSFVNSIEGATNVKQIAPERPADAARPAGGRLALAPAAHQTGPSGNFSIAGAHVVRQPHARQRRHHAGQHPRHAAHALHRGRDSGDHRAQLRRVGRVRPVLGRHHQRAHQVRRQSCRRDRSGRRSPTTPGAPSRPSARARSTRSSRPTSPPSGARSFATAPGSSSPAASVKNEVARETGITKQAVHAHADERRLEGKLTQSLGTGRRLSVNYLSHRQRDDQQRLPELGRDHGPGQPHQSEDARATGRRALRGRVRLALLPRGAVLGAQRSRSNRRAALSKDLIAGTPLARPADRRLVVVAELLRRVRQRRAQQQRASSSRAATSCRLAPGSHNIVFGYDGFNDRMLNDNQQSGSDYHVWATSSIGPRRRGVPRHRAGLQHVHHLLAGSAERAAHQLPHARVSSSTTPGRSTASSASTSACATTRTTDATRPDGLVAQRLGLQPAPRPGLGSDRRRPDEPHREPQPLRVGAQQQHRRLGLAGRQPRHLRLLLRRRAHQHGHGHRSSRATSRSAACSTGTSPRRARPFFVNIPGLATKINGSLRSPYADEAAVGVSRQLGRPRRRPRRRRRSALRRLLLDAHRHDDRPGRRRVRPAVRPRLHREQQRPDAPLPRAQRAGRLQRRRRHARRQLHAVAPVGQHRRRERPHGPLSRRPGPLPGVLQRSWYLPEGDLAADQRHRAQLWATYRLPWGRRIVSTSVSAVQVPPVGHALRRGRHGRRLAVRARPPATRCRLTPIATTSPPRRVPHGRARRGRTWRSTWSGASVAPRRRRSSRSSSS